MRSDAKVSADAEDFAVMGGGMLSRKSFVLVDANSVPLFAGVEDDAEIESKLPELPSDTPENKPNASTVEMTTDDAPTVSPFFRSSITSSDSSLLWGSIPPNQLSPAIVIDNPADAKQNKQDACNTPKIKDTR